MAVVIAIGGLLLGYGLSVLTAQMTNTRITTARDQENVIKTALITFLASNNRLPCPAMENLPDTNANYGVEAINPGTCTGTTDLTGASRGIVPWISLGLADSAALDGWNRRFTYVVTTQAVRCDPCPSSARSAAARSARCQPGDSRARRTSPNPRNLRGSDGSAAAR